MGLGALVGTLSGLVGVGLLACLHALADPVGRWSLAPLAPVLAGILTAVLARDVDGAHGTGVPAVRAAARTDRPLPLATGLGHLAATAACLGTGWTGGREGPMLHAGATIGSAVAARAAAVRRLPELPRLRLHLVAAGAAGGVAGVVNTPAGAALLVWALLLRRPRGRRIDVLGGLVVVAGAAAGSFVHGVVWAPGPLVPTSVAAMSPGVACIIGFAAAPAAIALVIAVHSAPRLLSGLDGILPLPVVGGVLVAATVLVVPQTAGTGTAVLTGTAPATAGLPLLVAMLAAAVLMPAVTVAARGCGGTIGPALVLGCIVGELVARGAAALQVGELAGHPEACRIVGMAAVLAAASRLPSAAVVTVIELTGAVATTGAVLVGAIVASVMVAAGTTATLFRQAAPRTDTIRVPA